jgi:hypothetical protein
MRCICLFFLLGWICPCLYSQPAAKAAAKPAAKKPSAAKPSATPPKPDPRKRDQLLRLQIFLDQHLFCPGKLDGTTGEFTEKAVVNYNYANGHADR